MKWMLVLIAALTLLAPAIASAQETASPLEITVHTGWSFLNAERETFVCAFCAIPYYPGGASSTVDNSIQFGAKVGYYLNNTMEIEGSFAVSPAHTLTQNGFPFCGGEVCPASAQAIVFPFQQPTNLVAYQYEGNFVYNFLTGAARPYATVGLGGISSDVNQARQNDFAFNFGAGAKFYFKHVGLRFEVNDHVIPSYFLTDKTEHNVQVQYGFLFRLP